MTTLTDNDGLSLNLVGLQKDLKTKKIKNITWGVPSFWIERFPMYYGEEKGIFRKHGIHLKMKYFYSGPEFCRAMKEQKIMIGDVGLPPFLKAYSQGLPARIIGSTLMQQLDHYLVARPDIHTIGDLRGKKIGILSFGSCDDYFIRRILEKEGLHPDIDVELVCQGKALGGDLASFSNGEVDAGFVVEPKVSLGESIGCLRVLARVGDYFPRYQWGVIVARNDFFENNIHIIKRIVDGYRESCRSLKENPEESVTLGSRLFCVEAEIFRKALLRNVVNWEIDARIDSVGLANAIQIQKELGEITQDLNIEEMVYNSITYHKLKKNPLFGG